MAAPGATASAGDRARPRRDDLVLHLHRLDDAEELPGRDLVAVGDLDLEHRPLHRADDGAVAAAPGARDRALTPSPCELGPGRRGHQQAHVVRAAVDLHPDEPRHRRDRSVRAVRHPGCRMRQRLLELLRTFGQLLRLDDARARLALHEARVLEQGPVEPEERRRAFDAELREGAQHPRDRPVAVDVVDDELRDHRVVQLADLVACLDPRVDADPRPGRLAIARDPPGGRHEAPADVLGVDPALDRVPAQHHVLLPDGERLARSDEHLLADQVEAGDELRHGVLHLDPGVHLHEEVLALAREQPLDRPGRAVPGGAGRVDRDPADALAQRVVDGRRGRLLDELLVAALDRAVALAEVDHVPVRVGEDLHLDVAGVFDEPLDVDGRSRRSTSRPAGSRTRRRAPPRRARRRAPSPCRRLPRPP